MSSGSSFSWSPCTATGGSLPPAARSGHTATSITSSATGVEMVVFFGGVNNNRYFEDVNVLELDEGDGCRWFSPPPSAGPGPRAFHCAAADGHKLYVFGGRNDHQQPRPDLWCLDADSWTWFLIAPLTFPPAPRDFASLCAMGDGKLILFGGYDGKRWLNDLHIVHVATGEWTHVTIAAGPSLPAPLPRSGHAAAFIQRSLLVFGGESSNGAVLSDLWALKHADGPALPVWTHVRTPTGPSKRFGHTWAPLTTHAAGDRILMFGGQSEMPEGLLGLTKKEIWMDDLYLYDTQRWLRIIPPKGPAPEGRSYHTFTPVKNGTRVLLFGGFSGKGYALSDCWWLQSDFQGLPVPAPVQVAPPAAPTLLQAPDLLGEEVPMEPLSITPTLSGGKVRRAGAQQQDHTYFTSSRWMMAFQLSLSA